MTTRRLPTISELLRAIGITGETKNTLEQSLQEMRSYAARDLKTHNGMLDLRGRGKFDEAPENYSDLRYNQIQYRGWVQSLKGTRGYSELSDTRHTPITIPTCFLHAIHHYKGATRVRPCCLRTITHMLHHPGWSVTNTA